MKATVTPRGRERHVDPAEDQELLDLLHRCLDSDEERWRTACIMLGWKRRELLLLLDMTPPHLDALAARVRRKLRTHPEFQVWTGRC